MMSTSNVFKKKFFKASNLACPDDTLNGTQNWHLHCMGTFQILTLILIA